MEYSINIHTLPVQRRVSQDLFINKLPQVRVTVEERALIHPSEGLAQIQHCPLYTYCGGDLGFIS